MANEFIAKKGLISTGSIKISSGNKLLVGPYDSSSFYDVIGVQRDGWASIFLDAGLQGEAGSKARIVSRRDYGQPFYIELGTNGTRVLDAWEGGAGVQFPAIISQNAKYLWMRIEAPWGYYHHMHADQDWMVTGLRLTKASTGTTATDGLFIGAHTGSANGRLWNYEANGTWDIGVNNSTAMRITTASISTSIPITTNTSVTASAGFNANGQSGWTGTININSTPPVAIYVQGGIITGVS
jgi:hypothetical protein